MRNDDIDRVEQAQMLADVYQAIGSALWEHQELEWSLSQLWLITRPGLRGAGFGVAAPSIATAEKMTFGRLRGALAESGHIPPDLAVRLEAAVDERNWIVHRSRIDSRGIINSRHRFRALLDRLGRADAEATNLREEVSQLFVARASEARLPTAYVERETERLLKDWGFREE